MPGDLSRRDFLRAGLAAAGGLLVGCASSGTGDAERPPVEGLVDGHVHLWSDDVARYPRAETRPASFTPEAFRHVAGRHGVERAVLVQPGCYGEDHAYLLEVLAAHPGRFAGVGLVKPRGDFERRLDALRASGVRGVRIRSGRRNKASWDAGGRVDRLWAACSERGLVVCLQVEPDALPLVDRICARRPDSRVAIDHFGNVGLLGAARPRNLDALCALARHDGVHVKASGWHSLGVAEEPYLDMLPQLRRVVDAFGPERVLWGSDSPSQILHGDSYQAALDLVRWRAEFLGRSDRRWILRGTAEKLFF